MPDGQVMLSRVEGLPAFGEETRADAILAACDGSGGHVPFPATAEGLRASADEMADETGRQTFPRERVADILSEYNLELGAPPEALANASRLAEPGSLAVVTGQQPLAAGGPLYVLYKALTAVRLANEAESALRRPVVPVFWNASEDHDIDEASSVAAPGRGGELSRFRAPLESWRGGPLSSIGPDARWSGPAREWIASLPGAGETPGLVETFSPRDGEGWSRWLSRIVATLLGPEGLVVIEPQPLRALAARIHARAVRRWEEIEALIAASRDVRASPSAGTSFVPLGGPPVFVERDGFRRRVLASGDGLALRGEEAEFTREGLASLAEREPAVFSSHGALRPVVQNALLPVVAQVLGPGEVGYQEELYRFHHSELGAGRRMPVPWPRLSATVLDERAASTVERLDIPARDIFAAEAELVARYTPRGEVAPRIRESAHSAVETLDAVGREALGIDATLARPLRKTAHTVKRAFEQFASRVEAAEARARGFAPEKLRRLSAWIRPGGRPQERVFSFLSMIALYGLDFPRRILDHLDVFDHGHRLVMPKRGDGE